MSSYNRSSSKKYLQLRPVTSKHAPEIVYLLPDKFSIFSSSSILQNRSMWEGSKIVHGKPRHSRSQGSEERANEDTDDILTT